MYRIFARIAPNNEVRVSMSPCPGAKDEKFGDDEKEANAPLLMSDGSDSVPLSLGTNSKTQRSSAGYGSLPTKKTKFGLRSVRLLRAHSAAMESVVPPEKCLFITGTLPGSTEAAFEAIARYSAYIVNSLKAWISNYEKSKLDFYCWEYQKRGALHLHYCVAIDDDASRNFIAANFKSWWISILHRIGGLAGCDLFRKNAKKTHVGNTRVVRAEAQIVKKSVGRYLAKYLSKSINPTRGNARFFAPSRWWGSSRPLKELARSLSDEFEIVVGAFHSVRKKWEEIYHDCVSSDSVTHAYKNKFGEGLNLVCYPNSKDEMQCLITELKSRIMNNQTHSEPSLNTPSQVLRRVKKRQLNLLQQLLDLCPEKQSGLQNMLEASWSMTQLITPSQSAEPLNTLLKWAADTSNIVLLCQYTPVWNATVKREFGSILDTLEQYIEIVASDGWS